MYIGNSIPKDYTCFLQTFNHLHTQTVSNILLLTTKKEFFMKLVILLILIILIIIVAICLFCYRMAFQAPRHLEEREYHLPQGEQYEVHHDTLKTSIEKLFEVPYEPIYISAFDGTKLFGRFYRGGDNTPVHLLFHGYKGNPYVDFSGGCRMALELGHSVILVDQRSHGQSDGGTITFGIKERRDVASWIQCANELLGENTPVFLWGISMGAATVLMAADLDLPKNVAGILADCPYSSPKAIIRKVCRTDMHLPDGIMYPFIRLSARLFGGFDLEESSAAEAVRNTKIPILLIHGEADYFVPCDMSHQIKKACPAITFLSVPEAGHGLAYMTAPEKYKETVENFIRAHS